MKWKKGLLIICIFLFLLSIASACASDLDENVTASDVDETVINSEDIIADVASVDVLSVEDNNQVIKQTDIQETVGETDDGTFTSLQNKIDNVEEGSTITLENDYKYDGSIDSIEIMKDLTIDGKGHTIDGLSEYTSINIGTTTNVVLKNINFSQFRDKAVNSFAKNLDISNCNFTANRGYSGIVSAYGYNGGCLKVTNCNFIDNYGDGSGTLQYVGSTCYITNCNFQNNMVDYGGAIALSSNDAHIANCNFDNNFAWFGGEAIWQQNGNLEVKNCNFTNNGDSQYDDDQYSGGAIYVDGGNLTVKKSNFKSNVATGSGGAIYCSDDGTCIVYDSTFIKNAAPEVGAVCNAKVIRCTFEGNSLPILNNVDDQNCVFNKDTAVITLSKSGSQYNDVTLIVKVKNLNTSENIAGMDVNVTFSNGKSVVLTTNSSGVATYKIPFAPSTYTATAKLRSVDYASKDAKLSIVISKAKATITPTALSTTYASGKYFTVKVVNSNTKKPISGVKLKLKVYTGSKFKTKAVTTNANGVAKYSASTLSIGTHKIVITPNDSKITASSKKSSVKISKAALTITAPQAGGVYKKSTKFTVTVKNKASGKPVKGIKVTFKVYTGKKFKTVTVKTNSKGQASYTSKSLSVATHKVKVTTAATAKYKAASKQSSIRIVKSKISTSIKSTNRINFIAQYYSGFMMGYTVTFDVVDSNGKVLNKNIDVYSSYDGYLGTIKSHVSSFVPSGGHDKLTFKFKGDGIYKSSQYVF